MMLQKSHDIEKNLTRLVGIVVCFNDKICASISKPANLQQVISALSSKAECNKSVRAKLLSQCGMHVCD
jgi:hypothetical protein